MSAGSSPKQRKFGRRQTASAGSFDAERISAAAHRVRTIGPSLLVLLTIILVPLFAVAPFIPPRVVPASAPATSFSAERALPHLRAIAQQPHPVGSPAEAQVREYLVRQLADMGLKPEIQQADVLSGQFGSIAHVQNILVRLPGTDSSRAVLVTAHYDSVVSGPGTGDDGVSVAAMLETLRAVQAGPALRNDLIFLFNDGEEPGMLGTQAFVQEHPWAKDVGVAFDFDADSPDTARTTLLWTTENDGWLVREIARSSAGVVSSSVSTVSKRVDAGNDLRMFAAAGITGAHFNVVAGSTKYHNENDSLANLDERRLQDHGNAMLALVRHFGNLSIGDTKAGNDVYFNVFGTTILHYPVSWAFPLEILAAIGLITLITLGVRRGAFTMRHLVFALVAVSLGVIVLVGLSQLGWLALQSLHPESRVFSERDFYGRSLFTFGLYAGTVAIVLAAVPWVARRSSVNHLMAVSAAWLLAILFLAGLDPSESYFGFLPLLAGVVSLAVLILSPVGRSGWWSALRIASLLLSAVVILGVGTSLLYRAAIDGMESGPAILIALLALFLMLMAPQLALIARVGRRWLPVVIGVLALGILSVMFATSGQSAANPRPDSLIYAINADSGQALWVSADRAPDRWTKQVLSGSPQHQTLSDLFPGAGSDAVLTKSAPTVAFDGPELTLLGQDRGGNERTIRVRLTSPRHAYRAFVLPGPGVQILEAGIAGKPVVTVEEQALRYDGLPSGGAELTLHVRATGPLTFTVIDESSGLPPVRGVTLSPRPDDFIGVPGPEWAQGDPTLVWRSVNFN